VRVKKKVKAPLKVKKKKGKFQCSALLVGRSENNNRKNRDNRNESLLVNAEKHLLVFQGLSNLNVTVVFVLFNLSGQNCTNSNEKQYSLDYNVEDACYSLMKWDSVRQFKL
jgi:hypothetical protein